MQKLLTKIPLTYRPFVLPFIVLLVIVGLTLTGGQLLLNKVNEERSKIDELKITNSRLTAKKDVLSRQNKEELLVSAQAAVNAVPGETPTLAALSSANNLAFDNGLTLTD